MFRCRKRRITCQDDLMETSQTQPQELYAPSSTHVKFMEEVGYKMEEDSQETSPQESNYVMVVNIDVEKQAHKAFKKKRKGVVEEGDLTSTSQYALLAD